MSKSHEKKKDTISFAHDTRKKVIPTMEECRAKHFNELVFVHTVFFFNSLNNLLLFSSCINAFFCPPPTPRFESQKVAQDLC